ncbi:MAG: diguanylate cyclase [Pseudomonadota bacterium]
MKPDQILASLSQLDHQKRPVTLVAIAFFSLVCLSLAGMQGWSVFKAREEQLAAAHTATVGMTRTLADHLSTTLDAADALLADVADRVETSDGDDAERLPHYVAQRLRRHPMLSGMSLYDDAGVLALGSNAAGSPAALPLHTEYHRSNPGSALFIGKPLRDAAGKQWLLPITRRLTMPDGSYGGMVLVSLRLAQLQAFSTEFNIGPHGSIAYTFDSGALLMARPDVASSSMASGGPLSAYQRLYGYPLRVTVRRSVDDVLAGWWESAYLSTAGAALLLLLQLWMGIRLYGQIALRDRLEKERRILQKLLVKKSRSLRHQALKDALTGIANRRQLDTRLVREFNRAIHEGTTLAMVILDVDYFKKYNDQHGHPAGDECLKFIANCVNGGRRRSEDLAARMGGEEFAILLPNTGLRGAIAVAESIRKTVASQQLTHIEGFPHSVTVSCGVHALIPTAGMLAQDLVDAADRALYLAKSSGRNRVRAEGTVPPTRGRRFSLVVNK